ncbi:MAG: hypothetical protein P8Y72_09285 [Anaerolineales bacterium]
MSPTIVSRLKGDEEKGYPTPDDEDGEETPEWLDNIRKQEEDQQAQDTPHLSGEEDDDDAWLDSIRQEEDEPEEADEEEGEGDFLEKIQQLKENDPAAGEWGDEDEESPTDWRDSDSEPASVTSAWEQETGGLDIPEDNEEEEIPDWVSGLPSLDPAEFPAAHEPSQEEAEQEESEEMPEWLKEIREKTSEDTKQPEDVLPAFGLDPDQRDADEDDEVPADLRLYFRLLSRFPAVQGMEKITSHIDVSWKARKRLKKKVLKRKSQSRSLRWMKIFLKVSFPAGCRP